MDETGLQARSPHVLELAGHLCFLWLDACSCCGVWTFLDTKMYMPMLTVKRKVVNEIIHYSSKNYFAKMFGSNINNKL
jgi:hypothetical protein